MAQLLQYYKSFQGAKNNTAAPTFEDLSIDDNLSELERVVRYCKSSIALQRLVHVKMLADVAKSVGFECTNEHILPLLEHISVDFESAIRSHLCDQIAFIAQFCATEGGEAGYQVVLDVVLPILAQLLEDDKVDVRQAASAALVTVAQIVQPLDLGQHVLTIILQLAHEDDNEEMRMTASELLNLLAEHLGFDLCKQFVIPEVVSLAEDPVFRVRKSTALNFQNVCKVGGEYELFERLMPAFVRLSKDDMYRVRRACAESLCEISKHVSDDIRAGVLVEIFLRLAQDPSKLVKQSVLQQSGMFISTLPPRVINSVILDHYCNMVNTPTGDMAVDAELRHYCAYSFPGVLQTVGSERWPQLRQVYHTLVQSSDTNVKQTLALSLHEVAKILGMKLAEEELLAVFEEMIQDIEVVRMGVIKYLADFLRLLSMPCRVSYLPLLDDILQTTSPFNWRLRKTFASQLPELVTLPPPQNVFSTLFPLAMSLLQDPVAQVRLESFKGIAKMMLVLQPGYVPSYLVEKEDGTSCPPPPVTEEEGTQYLVGVSRAINALVHGETYQHRQLWAELSLQLVKDLPREVFEKYFVYGVLQLTSDPVLNVRVSIAEMLSGWAPTHLAPWENKDSPWKWLLDRPDIRQCVQRLSSDDKDVYIAMRKLQPYFPDIEFKNLSCRGMKHAPGGAIPVGSDKIDSSHDDCNVPVVAADSPPSSVGKEGISPPSSLSSYCEEDEEDENEEAMDTFASDESKEMLVRQVKVTRRCTPSPTKGGVLAPEDIVVSDEESPIAVSSPSAEPSPTSLHLHDNDDDDDSPSAAYDGKLYTEVESVSKAPAQAEIRMPPTAPVDVADVNLDVTEYEDANVCESSTLAEGGETVTPDDFCEFTSPLESGSTSTEEDATKEEIEGDAY